MSWLSEGLKRVGVSKEVQRAITKPIAVATLGPFGAMIPVAKPNPATAGAPPVYVAQTQAAITPQDQAGAILQGFQAILNRGGLAPQAPVASQPLPSSEPKKTNWVPFAIAGAGVLVLGLGAVLAFKK